MYDEKALDAACCERIVVAMSKRAAMDYVRSNCTDVEAEEFFRSDRVFDTLGIDGSVILAGIKNRFIASSSDKGKMSEMMRALRAERSILPRNEKRGEC